MPALLLSEASIYFLGIFSIFFIMLTYTQQNLPFLPCVSAEFSGIGYIHTVVQPLIPPICRKIWSPPKIDTLIPLSQTPVNTILLSVGTDLITHEPETKPVLELEVHLKACFPNMRLFRGNSRPLGTIIPVL